MELPRLYMHISTFVKKHRWYVVVALPFLFAQIWVIHTGREDFPFMNWGMYSAVESPRGDYKAYRIYVSGAEVPARGLWDHQRQLVFHSLANYSQAVTKEPRYPQWLLHYLADMRLIKEPTLLVLEQHLIYENNSVQIVKSDTLIRYADE
ncbi:MAG: hypothetical protein U0T84_10210 [Chitinophagales bacterium]